MARRALSGLFAFLLLISNSAAAEDTLGAQTKAFADYESSYIITGMIKYQDEFKDHYKLGGKFVVDAISSASGISNGSSEEEAYIGGFTETPKNRIFKEQPNWRYSRVEMSANGGFKISESEAEAGYSYSYESTYISHTVYAGFLQNLFLKNTQIQAVYFHNFDTVDTDVQERKGDYPQGKNVDGISLGYTQVLSRSTIAQLTASARLESGALEDPKREMLWIDSDGTRTIIPEKMPDSRNRYAIAGRLAQYLWKGSSLHPGYRYYMDDWGISSHTVNADWFQYLGPPVILRVIGRIYFQQPSDYSTIEAVPGDDSYSANPIYSDFQSYLVGLRLHILDPRPATRRVQISGSIGADYYKQNARETLEDGYYALIAGGNVLFTF